MTHPADNVRWEERREHLTPVGLLADAPPLRTLAQAQFDKHVAMLERASETETR